MKKKNHSFNNILTHYTIKTWTFDSTHNTWTYNNNRVLQLDLPLITENRGCTCSSPYFNCYALSEGRHLVEGPNTWVTDMCVRQVNDPLQQSGRSRDAFRELNQRLHGIWRKGRCGRHLGGGGSNTAAILWRVGVPILCVIRGVLFNFRQTFYRFVLSIMKIF